MKTLIIVLLAVCGFSYAQKQGQPHTYMYYKSTTIVNGDTTVTEKTINGDGTEFQNGFGEDINDSLFHMKFSFNNHDISDEYFQKFFKELDSMRNISPQFFNGFPNISDFHDDFFHFPEMQEFFNEFKYGNPMNFGSDGQHSKKILIEEITPNSLDGISVSVATDIMAINIEMPVNNSCVVIQLIDNKGNILFKETIEHIEGLYSRQIPLEKFGEGNFEMVIIKDNQTYSKRIIISK